MVYGEVLSVESDLTIMYYPGMVTYLEVTLLDQCPGSQLLEEGECTQSLLSLGL